MLSGNTGEAPKVPMTRLSGKNDASRDVDRRTLGSIRKGPKYLQAHAHIRSRPGRDRLIITDVPIMVDMRGIAVCSVAQEQPLMRLELIVFASLKWRERLAASSSEDYYNVDMCVSVDLQIYHGWTINETVRVRLSL